MSAEGKPVLTDAPWSIDHGGENTGRLPLRSIVDGVSREAQEPQVAWQTSLQCITPTGPAFLSHCHLGFLLFLSRHPHNLLRRFPQVIRNFQLQSRLLKQCPPFLGIRAL